MSYSPRTAPDQARIYLPNMLPCSIHSGSPGLPNRDYRGYQWKNHRFLLTSGKSQNQSVVLRHRESARCPNSLWGFTLMQEWKEHARFANHRVQFSSSALWIVINSWQCLDRFINVRYSKPTETCRTWNLDEWSCHIWVQSTNLPVLTARIDSHWYRVVSSLSTCHPSTMVTPKLVASQIRALYRSLEGVVCRVHPQSFSKCVFLANISARSQLSEDDGR